MVNFKSQIPNKYQTKALHSQASCPTMSLRGAKRRSNLRNVIVINEIATLPLVARNDGKGIVEQPASYRECTHYVIILSDGGDCNS